MHAPGIWGIVIIAVVVILLFGRGKISGLMGEVAGGIKAFRKGLREDPEDAWRLEASAASAETRDAGKAKDA
jgi:sec-independent protein translocase protein TatA